MKNLFLSFGAVILCLISSVSSAENNYSFDLNVVSNDPHIKEIIEQKVLVRAKNHQSLIAQNNDTPEYTGAVTLYIFAQKNLGSNINKNQISLSIAHTSSIKLYELLMEVFQEGNDSSKLTKAITADLITQRGAVLKYLNVASIDDLEQIDTPIETILLNLSHRMDSYLSK